MRGASPFPHHPQPGARQGCCGTVPEGAGAGRGRLDFTSQVAHKWDPSYQVINKFQTGAKKRWQQITGNEDRICKAAKETQM